MYIREKCIALLQFTLTLDGTNLPRKKSLQGLAMLEPLKPDY